MEYMNSFHSRTSTIGWWSDKLHLFLMEFDLVECTGRYAEQIRRQCHRHSQWPCGCPKALLLDQHTMVTMNLASPMHTLLTENVLLFERIDTNSASAEVPGLVVCLMFASQTPPSALQLSSWTSLTAVLAMWCLTTGHSLLCYRPIQVVT